MYQIDVSTVASSKPASTSQGTAGYFTDGSPSTGVSATILPAEFLNSLMLEIMNAVTGAGLTLTKATTNQLYTAICTIAQLGGGTYGADGGAANAYAVTYSPTVSAPSDGMVRAFKVKTSNTGAATFALDGATKTYPIVGLAGSALTGGELVATGIAVMRFNTSLSAWVLYHCGLAPIQVAGGNGALHAAQLGQVQSGLSSYALDTGAANAYVLTLVPAVTAYVDGVKYRFRAANANTGASTVNINGLGAVALVGGAHSALVGGEIIAGGYCEAEYNASLAKLILLECTGAAIQIAPGTAPGHAVNLGQVQLSFSPVIGQVRNLLASCAGGATSVSYTADELIVGVSLSGMCYRLPSFSGTLTATATGIGGLDTGTVAASAWYAVYAAYNPTSGLSGVFATLDTPTTGTIYSGSNLPSGYTATALIGYVRGYTTAGQFLNFSQKNRKIFGVNSNPLSGGVSATASSSSVTVAGVPYGAQTFGGSVSLTISAAGNAIFTFSGDANSCGQKQYSVSNGAGSGGNLFGIENMLLSSAKTFIYYPTVSGSLTFTYAVYVSSFEF